MIVVIGQPAYRSPDAGSPDGAVGVAASIAAAAAVGGAEVQLIGKIGADAAGDALLLALNRTGVGHVAVLRDPARPTPLPSESGPLDPDDVSDGDASLPGEGRDRPDAQDPGTPNAAGLVPADPALRPALEPADLQLALAYVDGIKVIVVAELLGMESLEVVREAARYNGAHLVVVVPADGEAPAGLEAGTVLQAPVSDQGDVFAGLVGQYAAGLDAGTVARDAFGSAIAAAGWEPAQD